MTYACSGGQATVRVPSPVTVGSPVEYTSARMNDKKRVLRNLSLVPSLPAVGRSASAGAGVQMVEEFVW